MNGEAYRARLEHLEAIVAASPGDSLLVGNLAKSYFELGLRRYETDRLDEEAVRAFRQTEQSYDQAIEHMEIHGFTDRPILLILRIEAAELMGIVAKTQTGYWPERMVAP